MDHVTRTAQVVNLSQPADRPLLKQPAFVRPILLVFAVMAAFVMGQTILLRGHIRLSDPFADYAEIVPGQPWNATIGAEFSCTSQYTPVRHIAYCTRAPGNGPISLITITLRDGVIRWIDFTMAEDTLTVGDLAHSWGRPLVHLYGTSANFEWPDAGIKARGETVTGRFSYFVPLHQISLTMPDS